MYVFIGLKHSNFHEGLLFPQCLGSAAWQDEALARDGVSREVPCSALKGETVPDSLPAPVLKN